MPKESMLKGTEFTYYVELKEFTHSEFTNAQCLLQDCPNAGRQEVSSPVSCTSNNIGVVDNGFIGSGSCTEISPTEDEAAELNKLDSGSGEKAWPKMAGDVYFGWFWRVRTTFAMNRVFL